GGGGGVGGGGGGVGGGGGGVGGGGGGLGGAGGGAGGGGGGLGGAGGGAGGGGGGRGGAGGGAGGGGGRLVGAGRGAGTAGRARGGARRRRRRGARRCGATARVDRIARPVDERQPAGGGSGTVEDPIVDDVVIGVVAVREVRDDFRLAAVVGRRVRERNGAAGPRTSRKAPAERRVAERCALDDDVHTAAAGAAGLRSRQIRRADDLGGDRCADLDGVVGGIEDGESGRPGASAHRGCVAQRPCRGVPEHRLCNEGGGFPVCRQDVRPPDRLGRDCVARAREGAAGARQRRERERGGPRDGGDHERYGLSRCPAAAAHGHDFARRVATPV